MIDVFIDELDLSGLVFKAEPSGLGSPTYHPATLLKIYIYGYLNQIQTSRRLEREAHRNVELMWLVRRLTPTYKTIADFRKDHGKAIRLVGREFVLLCRKLDLFTEVFVAIDGSKFKADNNRDRNLTKAKLKRRIEQSIERYLSQIESADRQETVVAKEKSQRLQDKIEILKGEAKRLKKLRVRMQEAPDPHPFRFPVQAILNGLQYRFMVIATDTAVITRRTSRFDLAPRTVFRKVFHLDDGWELVPVREEFSFGTFDAHVGEPTAAWEGLYMVGFPAVRWGVKDGAEDREHMMRAR